jgi:TPR repeat protein
MDEPGDAIEVNLACVLLTPLDEQTEAAALPSADPSAKAVAAFQRGVAAYASGQHAAARLLWEEAAREGSREAEVNLGFLHFHGLGTPRDPEAAKRCWRNSVSFLTEHSVRGNEAALQALAGIYSALHRMYEEKQRGDESQ